ncbi:hypothetical protein K7432_005533 [Basidiobolus ranarum]|uniref:Yeast cell wall synthesis Kre9/Knh1-like N-terminal domain-containing protein n=1 Tax=Basidiobolus ranarum TaxID=34480 RepID=A0ABR2W2Z7_9FUNG
MFTFNQIYLLLILSFVVTYVNGEISITQPVEHTEWERGEDAIIEWKIDAIDLAELVTIELREGPKANLALSYEIATDIDPNEESHHWSVPHDLASGDKYSIRIVTDKGSERYSHYFKIN